MKNKYYEVFDQAKNSVGAFEFNERHDFAYRIEVLTLIKTNQYTPIEITEDQYLKAEKKLKA